VGQLGDGTLVNRALPVRVVGLPAAAVGVSTGGEHTCALIEDGTVWCWGDNQSGELGDGTTTSRPTPAPVIGVSDAVAVSIGIFESCALTSAGAVMCWGSLRLPNAPRAQKTAEVVAGLAAGVAAISTEGSANCALLDTGGIRCWGNELNGFGGVRGDGLNDPCNAVGRVSGTP
jgi:alpha-tubulin suppressor-like RCC1 family protein